MHIELSCLVPLSNCVVVRFVVVECLLSTANERTDGVMLNVDVGFCVVFQGVFLVWF